MLVGAGALCSYIPTDNPNPTFNLFEISGSSLPTPRLNLRPVLFWPHSTGLSVEAPPKICAADRVRKQTVFSDHSPERVPVGYAIALIILCLCQ